MAALLPTTEQVVNLIDAASRGRGTALASARDRLSRSDAPLALALCAGIEGAMLFAGLPGGVAPSPDILRVFGAVGRHERSAAALAFPFAMRACVLAFDPVGLQRTMEAFAEIADDAPTPVRIAMRLGTAWSRLAAGPDPALARFVADVEHDANAAGLAATTIDAAALQALVLGTVGELDDALRCARRASRMARTESLPNEEYFANLVLSRMRRLRGRPFHAIHILAVLRRFVSEPWRAWLRWEAAMAGDPHQVAEAIAWDGRCAAGSLAALLTAARLRDGTAVETKIDTLSRRVACWSPLREDLHLVSVALGRDAGSLYSVPWGAWQRGAFHDPPAGLAGLAGLAATEVEAPVTLAYVVVRANGSAIRVLSLALPLVLDGEATLPETRGRHARTDALLATLALAGTSGLPQAELFELVYGFPYEPAIHGGTFRVLIHRARERLGPHGHIEHEGEGLKMRVARPLVIPDPRCIRPTEDGLLAYLARSGRASARDASTALGLPLRTVQASLRVLVEDEALARHGSGRNVGYEVSDTTFEPPTHT